MRFATCAVLHKLEIYTFHVNKDVSIHDRIVPHRNLWKICDV